MPLLIFNLFFLDNKACLVKDNSMGENLGFSHDYKDNLRPSSNRFRWILLFLTIIAILLASMVIVFQSKYKDYKDKEVGIVELSLKAVIKDGFKNYGVEEITDQEDKDNNIRTFYITGNIHDKSEDWVEIDTKSGIVALKKSNDAVCFLEIPMMGSAREGEEFDCLPELIPTSAYSMITVELRNDMRKPEYTYLIAVNPEFEDEYLNSER